MTRLVIVRHGDTFAPGEIPRRIGASSDLPLTTGGMAQAHSLGLYFASHGYHFVQAFTSPLTRTRQTAELVLEHLGNAPVLQTASWLTEIDYGPDEGAIESAVVERIGAKALEIWESHGQPPVGWQVDGEARRRAWQYMMATSGDDDMLFITSNGAARFALLAMPEKTRPLALKLRTGSFGIIARIGAGRDTDGWTVADWNVRP